MELSISIYVIGVALGQWLGGPMSDHFGRKAVAYAGLVVFLLSSLAIVFCQRVEWLYVLRGLQALGGGATVVIAFATVRDHFNGPAAARVITGIGMVLLLAPLMAPAIGAALLTLFGWSAIFVMLAGYAVVLMLVVRFGLPPARPRQLDEPLRRRLFCAYGRVLRQRRAMGFILANGLGFSAMFTFITDAAFLYIDYFQVDESRFPFYFGINVVTMLCLNRLNVLLLRRFEPGTILGAAICTQCLASLLLLLLALLHKLTLWNVVPLIMVVTGVTALILPNAVAGFLTFFDRDSGTATGLNGCLQFLLAGLIGALIGVFQTGTPLPMTVLMAGSSVLAMACYFLLARRRTAPAPSTPAQSDPEA